MSLGRSQGQELTESWSRFRRCARELTESSLKLTEVWKMLSRAVENSPKVCQEVRREFANKLSRARRKFTGRMLGVRREFTEGDRELIGGPPKGCRELAKGSLEGCREFIGSLPRDQLMIGQQRLCIVIVYLKCHS
ncbi:hypothetical protein GW17_00035630 [Ensete ventricosum]|nr:hypothetical protein GW17_00035630 [Ensete ventricosum]